MTDGEDSGQHAAGKDAAAVNHRSRPRPHGVIFDIDGTLVDSVDLHARAWVDAFARYGVTVPYDEARSQIGKGGDKLMPVFLPPQELQRIGKQLEADRAAIFKRDYMPQVRAFPGVRALFEHCAAAGQRIALASSAKGDELEVYKRICGIDDLVAAATSKDDAAHSKPDPDIFAAALEQLGVPAEDAIAVGDSPYDAEAAAKLGLRCIGVRCGGFAEEDLRRAGCIALYDGPEALAQVYAESPLGA